MVGVGAVDSVVVGALVVGDTEVVVTTDRVVVVGVNAVVVGGLGTSGLTANQMLIAKSKATPPPRSQRTRLDGRGASSSR
jgi:hypothetical protein